MDYREFSDTDTKWINSFVRVMKKAPGELFMFVGAGEVVVYSERRMDGNGGDGVNQDVPHISVATPMDCDGGDW